MGESFIQRNRQQFPDITLLCGNIASFDMTSGISYRCHNCFATVGSMGMPKKCKELHDMEDVIDKLKGNI
jgi:hypothetical protein